MFERLKRALSGSPRDPQPIVPAEPGRLDWITRGTPYRFRTWLADPSQRNDVPRILDALIRGELTVDFIDEPDGRVRLDMVSTFEGWAAVHRVLYTLRRAGVRVRGLERLDMFDDVSPAELERLVNDWEIGEYKTAARRRTDTLTGEATLRYAIGVSRRKPKVRAWRTIAASVAHYTPGVETFLLETAASDPNADLAASLASAVAGHGEMAELVSEPFDPPRELVLAVARRRDRAAEAAYRLAKSLPAPLDDELTAVLCAAVRHRRRDEIGTDAVQALRNARPTDEVRAALETALESTDADIPGIALGTLGDVFGVGARPYWQAWLESSSWPRRMAAEDVMGEFGDAEDVPVAAEHLGKIIRRKSSISWEPPRGSEIIELLVRHRELPEAQAALADLTKRWPKHPEELQRWLKDRHPDLVPNEPAAAPAPAEAPGERDAEPPLTWPLPEIKRDGKDVYVGFWDTDIFDIRERFEELLDDHPSATLVDGDREWLTATIDAPDPEALIAELWARAQEAPEP